MGETNHVLRFLKDRFAPGIRAETPLPATNRVIYCNTGSVTLSDGTSLSEDQAWHGAESVFITSADQGAELWRWELSLESDQAVTDLGNGIACRLEIESPLDGPDPTGQWLMRCDSVRFPAEGQAFLHTHQGPGIRCLREGAIRIDVEGDSTDYGPGGAWFESGVEPVFAQAGPDSCSRFIRVMILPADLKGKSSIQYVNEEDLPKPKSQRYKGYVDECIEH